MMLDGQDYIHRGAAFIFCSCGGGGGASSAGDFLRAAKYSTDLSMYECRGDGEKTEKS